MKKNKKVSLSKKPFLVMSRRAIAGWLAAVFILCAWTFVVGVMVGRGTAPVKFNIDSLRNTLTATRPDLKKKQEGQTRDKTAPDFNEARQKEREEPKIDPQKRSRVTGKKVEPPAEKKPAGKTEERDHKKSTPGKRAAGKAGFAKKEPDKRPPSQPVASKSEVKPSTKVYTVQVAAVKAAENADRLVAQLKKKGYPAYRTIGKAQGAGIWFRVRVGHFKNRTDALSTMQKLKKAGMKPIVVEK